MPDHFGQVPRNIKVPVVLVRLNKTSDIPINKVTRRAGIQGIGVEYQPQVRFFGGFLRLRDWPPSNEICSRSSGGMAYRTVRQLVVKIDSIGPPKGPFTDYPFWDTFLKLCDINLMECDDRAPHRVSANTSSKLFGKLGIGALIM